MLTGKLIEMQGSHEYCGVFGIFGDDRAAEFAAFTPYYYSTYEEETEA